MEETDKINDENTSKKLEEEKKNDEMDDLFGPGSEKGSTGNDNKVVIELNLKQSEEDNGNYIDYFTPKQTIIDDQVPDEILNKIEGQESNLKTKKRVLKGARKIEEAENLFL